MRIDKMEIVDAPRVSSTYQTRVLDMPSTKDKIFRKETKAGKYTYLFIKRTVDIIASLVGIVLLIPITVFIGIANYITGNRGPIFYSQERIGKNGQAFRLYKFRSMCMDADKKLEQLLETDENAKKEWEANQKLHNDPRITKIGKFIRKASIDEIPQFINVLKGDMSLVGPRPLVRGELDAHNGNHKLYESVRPGITSWWACNGRSDTSYVERLRLEYYYTENKSLGLDLKCVFKTIAIVLNREGAK